jgi:hypothetical protein
MVEPKIVGTVMPVLELNMQQTESAGSSIVGNLLSGG